MRNSGSESCTAPIYTKYQRGQTQNRALHQSTQSTTRWTHRKVVRKDLEDWFSPQRRTPDDNNENILTSDDNYHHRDDSVA